MVKDLNDTLNLPKTEFPMRAGLPQREPEFLKLWEQRDIYAKLMEKNAQKPKHILHDGPPFSNGSIHLGTALNKILKDFINRYKSMTGYLTPYVPGWDNHGMPIESAIIKQNKLDRKSMSVSAFRDECHKFAQRFVEVQKEQFIRLGVMGDWDNPYLTMAPQFEAEEVRAFGKMFEKGYIYKGLKPVYWCTHDETALAEAEIEYNDEPCTSVYVKFALKDDLGKLNGICEPSQLNVLIWTTTIWTLPGNLAIALHPQDSYAIVKTKSGEFYLVAEALCKKVMEIGKIDDYEIVTTMQGRMFENMTAQHPFLDRESRLVLADYVTMDSGTGCVHTAPGFGADDYNTCRKYGIDLIVPVDDKGYQTEDAGKFAGLRYDKSNDAILEDMKQTGALFAAEDITHSYPHCWRCHTPIIFRATPQWFCSVEAFKEEAVKAIHSVRWLPAWGEERIASMVSERADWCISRQRHWGLPIPVFYCEDCQKPVCNEQTIETVASNFERDGSNAWYDKQPSELLPDGFKCPHCGGSHFTKETDTLDGWFDSGSTNLASLLKDGGADMWPADIFLEGADQYRGWFQSSLLIAVGAMGKGAPYKSVITHGWVVDGQGKAMHKSLGNSIAPEEVIKKYGADLLRLWVAASDYRVDIRVSDDIFKQLSQTYLKIRNTCRYILGNLDGFDPNNMVKPEEMLEIDRWAITRLNALIDRVMAGYEQFEYHVVSHSINNFCVVDMSNFYLDVIKDRLYCEGRDSISRRSAQTAMYMVLDTITRMLAPILAFTADEIWRAMPHQSCDDAESVIFNDMHSRFDNFALTGEQTQKWNMLTTLRDEVNIALEQARAAKLIGKPLEASVKLSCTAELAEKLAPLTDTIKTILIVSEVLVEQGSEGTACEGMEGLFVTVQKASGEKCERCWCYDPSVGTDSEYKTACARCAQVVRGME